MKTLVAAFCYNALSNTNGMPRAEQADHFDLAGDVLSLYDLKEMAAAARAAAADLRDAEASQLKFQALLSSALN